MKKQSTKSQNSSVGFNSTQVFEYDKFNPLINL